MKIHTLKLAGLKLVELPVYGDERGFFVERFQQERFQENGLPAQFFQDNHSRSAPGVVRGLHYQQNPNQGKLIGVVRGRIWDVAVDLRADSPTFGEHIAVELSDMNGSLLWVPPGFGHGFCVLGEEPADVMYKVDARYNPQGEGGVRWNDPELAIPWPVSQATVSARDEKLPSFAEYRAHPLSW
jgi:dTDP-4-dehydrorhamnose 3,5-epimerase